MNETLNEALARRKKEEDLLCFDKFSNEDALALGLKIVEMAKERGAAVAIDIEINGNQMFHYAMPGSNKRHAMWIRRKQNMVQTSQVSTLHAYYQLIRDGKDQAKDWRLNEADYGAIGGGFPITITGTGSGHNVGMSQQGARAMALRGMDYIDILTFYFTDVTVG